ncbi:MAG: class I SAM-dependent methyltransferase, partial [Isosphaeraceae bacterium]
EKKNNGQYQCCFCLLTFPVVAGMVDLRLHSDRYLSLNQERQKARRLAGKANSLSLEALARAYYAITADVDEARRERFVSHILQAENRGLAILSRLPKNGDILEIGCGTGGFLAAAAKSGRNAFGIDIASRWLVVARSRLQEARKNSHITNILPACTENLPYTNDSWKLIVADSLLEHVDDAVAAIREMVRVVRPGGLILIWTPNRRWLGPDPHVGLWLVKFLPEKWARSYLKRRRGDIFWPKCRSSHEWESLLKLHFPTLQAKCRPADTSGWPKSDNTLRGYLVRLCGFFGKLPIFKSLLKSFGPLIEIQIRKPDLN